MITIFQCNFYLKQRLLQQHHEKKTSEKLKSGEALTNKINFVHHIVKWSQQICSRHYPQR